MENEQIAKRQRRKRMPVDNLDFLPVVAQRNFELPGFFPPFDSMAEGDPCVCQIMRHSVIVGGDEQPSGERSAGEMGQAELRIDAQLDFTFDGRCDRQRAEGVG
jgi:hypothetical protein